MSDTPTNADQIKFKVYPAGGGSEVPASLLVQIFSKLQELVHLFALQEEGGTVRQRLRLSDELKRKYVLHLHPPEVGSFAVAGRVAGQGVDSFVPEQARQVLEKIHQFSHAVVSSNEDGIRQLVPDGRLRHRTLSCLSALSPPPGSGYRYEMASGTEPSISLDETLPARIEEWLKTPEERAEAPTVTGRLEAISFGERKLTIIYRPKSRQLECFYDQDIELMLLENRRGLIQVTGQVLMDDEGHPKRIDEVEQIRELELSPFVLSEIAGRDFRLRPRNVFRFLPGLTDDEQFLCLEHAPWSLDVFAITRAELFSELKEQIVMLWQEYA
ncbi:MAG: hypothetical protein V2J55_04915, partial [Candidatus Competibacteraceae bacterium]|nr:hypothetical protein [Candidatus Competibacteraceae bacterium]